MKEPEGRDWVMGAIALAAGEFLRRKKIPLVPLFRGGFLLLSWIFRTNPKEEGRKIMNQIVGTPQTDDVIVAVAESIKAYKLARADGKLDWADFGYFMPVLPRLAAAVDGSNQILPELKDLDSAEGAALIAKIAGLSGEVSEQVKLIVGGLVKIVQGGLEIYGAVKKQA